MGVIQATGPVPPTHVVLLNPRAQQSHRRLPLSVLFAARGVPEGMTWEIIDANIMPDARQRLDAALGRDPDHSILLVTVMPGPQLRQATPWCRDVRARFPTVRIVWGGYFPTVYPAAVAKDPAVDVVVMGQGERTLAELLPLLAQGGDPAGLPGTAVWRDGALITGPERPLALSASFGDPAYDRLPMERYAARTFLGARTFNHHSSVGCPYVCNFCAVTSMFEGRWLADKPDDVLRVVRRLHRDHGADAIEFHDNNFFAAEKRTREIAAGMVGLNLRWWGEARIDTMLGWSELTWKTLSQSGLAMVFYGAESGDQAALDAMDKGGLQVADIRALNRRAKGHGIIPEFSFVLGNPADPAGDIDRSLRLVEALKDENPDCEIILYLYTPVPLPGMFDQATEQGFAFPDSLDDWLSPQWYRYEDRRNPGTPWLTPSLIRRVYDFEAVLHARWPSTSDRNLRRWQRAVLRALSTPRQRLRLYQHPYELKLLQRAWSYRRPEEMGF
jgi:anaerobic magnesium-protoporphyrin IX monomethyl ester cyclase